MVLLFLAYRNLFRYLGPYNSGQYQFILSYVLMFSTVVDFGIQQFIIKKMSEKPEETENYFRQFLAFESAVSFFLYALLISIAYFRHFDPQVLQGIALAGLGMVANALTYPFLSVMSARQDLRKVAFINFLNSLVNVSVIALAIIFHKGIVFLASIQLIFGLLDLALYRVFVLKHLPAPKVLSSLKHIHFELIWSIINNAWPFVLLVGFSAIYNRIDVVILTFLKGYQETGYYTAAYKIYDLLGFFPSVVSFTLFPFFTGLMAKNAILEIKDSLEKYTRLMLMFALPMAVGGTILAQKLIILVTASREFLPGAQALAILIWAPALLFIYIPVNSLVISQLTRKALIITGTNVVVNIVGNLLLIPRFGIQAAAVMTVLSESLQGIFYFYFVRKNITDFKFWGSVFKPAFAALVMGLVLWPIRDMSLLITLAAGAAVYMAMLTITRFIGKDDIVVIKGLFRRESGELT